MDWREEYKRKTVSAEEAVKVIKSGDKVVIPLLAGLDILSKALGERKEELRGVEILQGVAPTFYPWYEPGYEEAFTVNLGQFTGPIPRQFMWDRKGDFTAVTYGLELKDIDERRPGCIDPDVVMVRVCPPDENGFCNFGTDLWEKKEYVKRAKIAIAEVDETVIRTCGDTFVHVSQIDYFVDASPYIPTSQELEDFVASIPDEKRERIKSLFDELKPPAHQIWAMKDVILLFPLDMVAATVMGAGEISDDVRAIAQNINTLIKDCDCLQIGTGNTSNPLVRAGMLDGKNDLGFHCEVAPPTIANLIKEGLFTGKYKTNHKGKAVCATFRPGIDWRQEELEYVNGNPLFEIYGSHYTNNVVVISANDNQVSINNALFIDLTGQIACETLPGFLLYNGPGGQLDWVIGALYSKGGRSITVLPSTALEGALSRIVPLLEEGVMATVPRTYADLVVTEYGIASLLGKSQRRRAEELIAVAHPDHRAELREKGRGLFWPL